jgi:hypothetical protein
LSCCSSGIRNVCPFGRPDNRGRAGPEIAAVFRCPNLTGLSEPSEGGNTHEKEPSMSSETRERRAAPAPGAREGGGPEVYRILRERAGAPGLRFEDLFGRGEPLRAGGGGGGPGS